MRYSQTHKQETHRRLVAIAAKALSERGPDRVGVAEVMRSAGLTHGGFYAHFKSKDALLVEALGEVFDQAVSRVRKNLEGLPPRHALATFIDSYVSRDHRDKPESGCPLTTLNSDLPRQPREFREAFDRGVREMGVALGRLMKDAGLENGEEIAPSILSAMVGAVSLSRAVNDKVLSDDLLASARAGIKLRLGLSDALLSGSV